MTAPTRIWRLPKVPLALTPYASQLSHWSFSPAAMGAMRTSRPAAEKLGAARQDPDLDDLLFRLISRATGGRQEHAARADRPLDDWGRTRVNLMYLQKLNDLFMPLWCTPMYCKAVICTVQYSCTTISKMQTAGK